MSDAYTGCFHFINVKHSKLTSVIVYDKIFDLSLSFYNILTFKRVMSVFMF